MTAKSMLLVCEILFQTATKLYQDTTLYSAEHVNMKMAKQGVRKEITISSSMTILKNKGLSRSENADVNRSSESPLRKMELIFAHELLLLRSVLGTSAAERALQLSRFSRKVSESRAFLFFELMPRVITIKQDSKFQYGLSSQPFGAAAKGPKEVNRRAVDITPCS